MYSILEFAFNTDADGLFCAPTRARPRKFPPDLEFLWNRELPERVEPLSFVIEQTQELPDYIKIHKGGAALCSQRLLDLLASEHAVYTAYPAQLYNETTGVPIDKPYSLWIPQRIANAIDWERTATWQDPDSGLSYLIDLALVSGIEAAAPAVFRHDEKVVFLVHERVQRRMHEAHISGVDFLPLVVIHQPTDGYSLREVEHRLELEPENAALWVELGHLWWRLHHYERAFTAADKAVALQPELAAAWHILGKTLQHLTRLDDAVIAYRRALQLEESGLVCADLAAALLALRKTDEAVIVAERATQLNSSAPAAWYELGRAAFAAGSYEVAVNAFDRAVSLSPGFFSEGYVGKGDAFARLGRQQEALAAYERGLEFRPNDLDLWRGKAEVLRTLGRTFEAEAAERRREELKQERAAIQAQRPR